MHPRNLHQDGYDFPALCATSAALAKYVVTNPDGTPTIDFSNPKAVKLLNRALLMHYYGVNGWELPTGYLCPPIPGRADYLHSLADWLAKDTQEEILHGPTVRGLDIGTGANLVYPLVGQAAYGWSFVGTEIDPLALENAGKILAKNPQANQDISLREQTNPLQIFKGLLRQGEFFDFCMCNPPFHASPDEVRTVSQRTWHQLGQPGVKKTVASPKLNFGGADHELWCEGGERGFIKTMIEESKTIPKRVRWFSTLVSKADNLKPLEAVLKKAKVVETAQLPMSQGQKQSRILLWTFLNAQERMEWGLKSLIKSREKR